MFIFTLGLANTDNELVNLCSTSEAFVNVSDEAMREALVRLKAGNVQVISDTRRFCDPAAVGNLTKHLGEHPETLKRMSATRKFGPWLRGLRMDIQKVLFTQSPTEDREVRVALYCRSGKHRSVAGARFLAYIAEWEGWDCKVEHLARKHWVRTCKGVCDDCQGKNDPQTRQEALDEALRIWSQNGRERVNETSRR